MDWNLDWIVFMIISFLIAVYNLAITVFAKKNTTNICIWCVLLSTILGMLSMLQNIQVMGNWIKFGEMANVQNYIPAITNLFTIYIIVLSVFNLISVILNVKDFYFFKKRS